METKLFLAQYGREKRFPELWALADRDHKLMDHYKVVAVPYAVVVDEDGRVGAKGAGFSSSHVAALISQAEEVRQQRQARSGELQLPGLFAEVEAERTETSAA